MCPLSATPTPSRRRLWIFRLLAVVALPAAFLLAVELGLRVAGAGYDPGFLVPVAERPGVLTTNPRFGWRFFPRRLARTPVPFELAPKTPGVYRIFVVGGSAARGTPDPAYAFGRVLEAMLEERFPGARFEVRNAAMTAINSHVALPIVRAVVEHEPDLLIVYLGNNEVVGPYGAATVFSGFSPRLGLIRAAIALETTRVGQALDALLVRDDGPAEWRGMEMFLDQRLAADDPRLEKVYAHFRRNLDDMVRAADDAGVRVLLATVATNLRDQPPFASLHRPGLEPAARARWAALVETGAGHDAAGRTRDALTAWTQAAAIDDRHAELRFRIGRAHLELGDLDAARAALRAARDLDALRFRADSRINETIRRAAREAPAGTLFADPARVFAEGGDGVPPLPGHRLFHEHVHLDFAGNHALAGIVFRVLEPALPAAIRARSAAEKPIGVERAAERLAYTPFDRYELEREMLRLVARPPFTATLGHAADLERRRRLLLELRRGLDPDAWRAARALYERRLQESPADLELRRRFAGHLETRGDPAAAASEWRFLAGRLPGVLPWRSSLALALADSGRTDEALDEIRRLLERGGHDLGEAGLWVNLGTVLARAGRDAEAEDAYRRALERDPRHAMARFNLANAARRRGEAGAAADGYREILRHHPAFTPALHNLGLLLEQRGEVDEAIALFLRALDAEPWRVATRNSLALALERRGEIDAAAAEYLRALEWEPGYARAHFNLADLLLAHGRAVDAARHYRQGLATEPGNRQARANLELALELGRPSNG